MLILPYRYFLKQNQELVERTNSVDLRLGILNDTHITSGNTKYDYVTKALNTLKTLGADKLALIGDNVYYTKASDDPKTDVVCYNNMYNMISESGYLKSDIISYAMGNHEFPQGNYDTTVSANSIKTFTEQTGFEINHHIVYEDFHFIAGGAKDYGGTVTTETEAYLMREIDAAIAADSDNDTAITSDGVTTYTFDGVPNSKKPVFLLLHHPIGGTLDVDNNNKYTPEFYEFLKTRPQVILITAHEHRFAQQPQNIWQDGFTAFLVPMTAGGYHEEWATEQTGNITQDDCSQGTLLEIKDNVVSIIRLDYNNDCYIGEPFVVDIPKIIEGLTNQTTEDDTDAYLYSADKRTGLDSVAAFPADAKLDVNVVGNAVSFKYPNTATMTKFDSVQQDYFVRGYKVELVHSSGRIVSSKTYQADFWKKESDRTAYYSKSFGQLDYDTEYTINIYPMTPFGAFSSPLSHTFTTEEEVVDSNSVRYEFEDYNTKYSRMNYDSIYASDGALVVSAQGGFSDKEAYLTTTEEESPYSLTFTVDLPYDVEYNIEYAVGYIYGSDNVSKVEILVDETSIGTNDNSFDRDLSAVPGDTSAVFPWKYIPLKHCNGKTLKLSKGEHTVTAKIYRPTVQTQPYLFCLDYIQFTPKTAILDMSSTAKIEAENYVDGITITETSGATYSPKQGDSTICSNQKYAAFDSNPVVSSYYDFVIPIFAKEPGLYNFEYVINSNTGLPSIYLGDADTGIKINSTYTETKLGEFVDGKNTYFNSTWATASKYYVENVAIPYGSNNITIRIPARTGENDIVLYTDYLQFSPSPDTSYVTIDEAGKRIEFEDCLEDADLGEKVLGEGFASKDYYVFNSWRSYAKTHSINTFVEFTESGNYNIEYLIGMQSTHNVSLVELYLNDTVIATNDASYTRNLYDESQVGWKHAPLCLYKKSIYIEAGKYALTAKMYDTADHEADVCKYQLDYIEFKPNIDKTVSPESITRIEFEDYATIDIGYKVEQKIDGVKTMIDISDLLSNGKFLWNNWGTTDDQKITADIKIAKSGYYDIEYLVGHNKSNNGDISIVEFYLNDILIGKNDGSYSEILWEDDARVWNTAPMSRYYKNNIWLDEGIYILEAVVHRAATHSNKIRNYQMDYIEFTPSDSLTLKNDTATATVVIDKAPVSGKAILALYNGTKLVGTDCIDVTDERLIIVPAYVEDAITSAKVFVWDDFTHMTPQISPVNLSLN